jgi:hypothetical protein
MSAANVVTPKNRLPNPLRFRSVDDALLRAAGVRLTSLVQTETSEGREGAEGNWH